MRQKKILILLSLMLFGFLGGNSQESNQIKYENLKVTRQRNSLGDVTKLRISMDILVNDLAIKSREMLVLTPQISSDELRDPQFLPQVIIAGNNRMKVLRRQFHYSNQSPAFDLKEAQILRANDFKKEAYAKIHYEQDVDYSPALEKGTFGVAVSMEGCASCLEPGIAGFLPLYTIVEPYQPHFTVAYVTPEVELVKVREESLEARFNYRVARYELLVDYKGNKAELDAVDKFVRTIMDDKTLNVSDYQIEGFASPEGDPQKNLKLSRDRANTFASYLKTEYNIPDNRMNVKGFGEDWDGLRKVVEESNLEETAQILAVIDNNAVVYDRKRALEQLNGGKTYRNLLENYYPSLRRNTLRVGYTVKEYDTEEALEAYRLHPNRLSLEEFYRVSSTFPKGSKEFKEVFQTALRFFPDSEIALLNTSSAMIDSGDLQEAEKLLAKAGDHAEILNNRGVLAFHQKDFEEARKFFEEAKAKGSHVAVQNLEELKKFEETN